MEQQLIKAGFTNQGNGEFIMGNFPIYVIIIKGHQYSAEIISNFSGNKDIIAALPVNSITEVEAICNNHNIQFKQSVSIKDL